MDRLMSNDERIRRAEEVAERRRNAQIELDYKKKNTMRNTSKTKNIVTQVCICVLIYSVFYYVKTLPEKSDSTQRYIENIKNILNQDVDFGQIYNQISNWFIRNNSEENKENTDAAGDTSVDEVAESNEGSSEESSEKTNADVDASNSDSQQNENLGIGGEYISENGVSEEEPLEQDDAMYISQKINLENPLKEGIVTSGFGERASNEIVSANHKGIDLGAPTGTSIVSACDGKVTKVSSTGDFGKHIQIQNDDITFIYAHCSKLLVNEGDSIVKGQKIAEVGSTGRATGPHLHFEIRRGERSIDPSRILKFD